MSLDLCYMPASELLAQYAAKTLSPVDVTKAILARAAAVNAKINAYNLIDEVGALRDAQASEARWAKGTPMGLADGVPVSIKDIILTKGWPTLRGSKTVDPNQPWTEDAPIVARFREHGAVILGKTTTPEFGWKGVTDSPLTGITRNPWKLDRTPGGSSGGASAALAAGLGAMAVGTDGGGSIRIPSGFTGVFGLKPSFGRVPAYPLSAFGTVAHVGPMTRTVRDAALMLTIVSGKDVRDWHALPADGHDYSQGLDGGVKGLKIAFSASLGYAKVDSEVAAIVADAVKVFASLGAKVEARDPGFSDPADIFHTHWYAGVVNALRTLSKDQLAMLDPGLLMSRERGLKIGLEEYLVAVSARGALGAHMRQFHESYDLLVTPTLAVPAFEAGKLVPPSYGDAYWTAWTPFSYPFNLTQQPAASINCGFTSEGLPVGLHIVGPMYRDDLVLRAAQAFETARPLHSKRPPL